MTHFPNIPPDHFELVQFVIKNYLPNTNDPHVYVFGSRAKSTPCKKFSDLDLAIDAGRQLTIRDIGRIKDAFCISDLPYRVDIVDLNDLSDHFKKIVEAEMVELPIYTSPSSSPTPAILPESSPHPPQNQGS